MYKLLQPCYRWKTIGSKRRRIQHRFRQRLNPLPASNRVPQCVEPAFWMSVYGDGEETTADEVAQCAGCIYTEQRADDVQQHEWFAVDVFEIEPSGPQQVAHGGIVSDQVDSER
mgnify:CR=1 FL=1